METEKILELGRNAISMIKSKGEIMKKRYYLYFERLEDNLQFSLVYTHPSLRNKRSVRILNGETLELHGYSANTDFNDFVQGEGDIPESLIVEPFDPMIHKGFPMHKSTIHKIMNNNIKQNRDIDTLTQNLLKGIFELLEKSVGKGERKGRKKKENNIESLVQLLRTFNDESITNLDISQILSILEPYQTSKNATIEVLRVLQNFLEEKNEQYTTEPLKYSSLIDGVRHLYEELLVLNYNEIMGDVAARYPSRENPHFQQLLERKKEIQLLKQTFDKTNIIRNMETSCEHLEFMYQNHQKITDVLLNPSTPYRSILVYHGTGVGKTCSAILSAESFIEKYPNNKVHIVLPPNVIGSFMKEIFNIDSYEAGRPQCTGDKYPIVSNMIGENSMKTIQKAIQKIIRNVYDMRGPIKFANDFVFNQTKFRNRYKTNPELGLRKFRDWIIENYDNSFIIVDEVHLLRTERGKRKQIKDAIEHILRVTKNVYFMTMSATPIYNRPEELAEIMTLLRINEGRSPLLVSKIISPETESLIQENIPYIKRKTAGYVSYMRSENPLYFAQQVYPSLFKPEDLLTHEKMPTVSYRGQEIQKFNAFELIDVEYNEEITEHLHSVLETHRGGLNPEIAGRLLQNSNLSLPTIEDENPSLYGEDAIRQHFNYRTISKKRMEFGKVLNIKQKQFSYKPESIESYGGIMTSRNLEKYGKKIHKIMESVLECCSSRQEGIIFIYSRYLESGVIPISLALEELGFTKYGGIPLLSNPVNKEKRDYRGFLESEHDEEKDGKFIQGKYILLTGNKDLTQFLQEEVRRTRMPGNINGQHVKIIVGNEVVSEGVDFHNIRSLHVLEPWYHFNLLVQVIGRAVRFCRHSDMEITKRNVMVHLYGTRYSSKSEYNNEETIDMYMYRTAENKAKRIGQITRLLKENSVDCNLNKEMNVLKIDDINIDIENSSLMNGTTVNIPIGDKPNSYHCDFMEDCDYKCTSSYRGSGDDTSSFYPDSYYYEIMSYILKLKRIMKENDTIMIRDLIQREKMNEVILNEVLLRMNNNDNYLIYRGKRIFKLQVLGNMMITLKPVRLDLGYHSLPSRVLDPIIKSRYSMSYYNKSMISQNEEQETTSSIDINNILEEELNNEGDFLLKQTTSFDNNVFDLNGEYQHILMSLMNRLYQLGIADKRSLTNVRNQMLVEMFILTSGIGEQYLQNIVKGDIDGEIHEKIQQFLIKGDDNSYIGYVSMNKDGLVVKMFNRETESFEENGGQRRVLIEKVKAELRRKPAVKKLYGYRKMEKNSYNFKLHDTENARRKGFNCHTTGQVNNYKKVYERFNTIKAGLNLNPVELLKFGEGKDDFKPSIREKYEKEEKRFPSRFMCLIKEVIFRIQDEINNDNTFFITFPYNHIYNSRNEDLLKIEE